jgi:predicted ATP-dependent serine protease
VFRCRLCGRREASALVECPGCKRSWPFDLDLGSFDARAASDEADQDGSAVAVRKVGESSAASTGWRRRSIGLAAADRVLGTSADGSSGLVLGGATYVLSASAGAGKTTLALRAAAAFGDAALYVSNEGSERHFQALASRIGWGRDVPMAWTASLPALLATAEGYAEQARGRGETLQVLFVDQIHRLEGDPFRNASHLCSWAQAQKVTIWVNAERTGQDELKTGPRLRHLFDCVLALERPAPVKGAATAESLRRFEVDGKNRYGETARCELLLTETGWQEVTRLKSKRRKP